MRLFFTSILYFASLTLAEWCVEEDFFWVEPAFVQFDTADIVCQSRGGRLATFRSPTQMDFLRIVERFTASSDLWVGIEHDNRGSADPSDPFRFDYSFSDPPQDSAFFVESFQGNFPFAPGQPSGLSNEFQHCMTMNTLGFDDRDCFENNFVLCRIANACDEGFSNYNALCIDDLTGGIDLFPYFSDSVEFSVAQVDCFEKFGGNGQLASFDNFFEFNEAFFRLSLMIEFPFYLIGIELGQEGDASTAFFTDSTVSSFLDEVQAGNSPPWFSGEPFPSAGFNKVFVDTAQIFAVFFSTSFPYMCKVRDSTTCANLVSAGYLFVAPPTPSPVPVLPLATTCVDDTEWIVTDQLTNGFDAPSACFGLGFDVTYGGVSSIEEFTALQLLLSTQQIFSPVWSGFQGINAFSTNPAEFVSFDGFEASTSFIQGTANSEPPWQVEEPSASDFCVAMDAFGLFDEGCFSTFHVLCVNRNPGVNNCGGGGETVILNNICLGETRWLLTDKVADQFAAESICSSLDPGIVTLSGFNDISELLDVNFMVNDFFPGESFWTGFRTVEPTTDPSAFFSVDGNFIADSFIQGTQNGAFPWSSSEPNLDDICVSVSGGFIFDSFCSEQKRVVCAIRNPQFSGCGFQGPPVRASFCDGETEYIIVDETLPQGVSREACGFFNAELVSFRSVQEFTTVNDFLVQNGFSQDIYWVGFENNNLPSFAPTDFTSLNEDFEANLFIQSLANGQFPWDVTEPSGDGSCVAYANTLGDIDCSFNFFPLCVNRDIFSNGCQAPVPQIQESQCLGADFWIVLDSIQPVFDAEIDCSFFGHELAGYFSQQEFDAVNDFLNGRGLFSEVMMTGYTSLNPTTNPADFFHPSQFSEVNIFIDSTVQGVSPWGSVEPNLKGNCVILQNNRLFDIDCQNAGKPLCVQRFSESCIAQQTCVNNVTYEKSIVPRNFFDAQADCQSKGGSLVKPKQPSHLAALEQSDLFFGWVGVLADSNTGDSLDFRYVDGDTVGIEFLQVSKGVFPWSFNQPRSNDGDPSCVVAERSFLTLLSTQDCNQELDYVCELPTPCSGFNIPDDWFCRADRFDNRQCDCRCGAVDPDCEFTEPGSFVENCGFDLCNEFATCDIPIPVEWTCLPEAFNSFDGCDCGCGAPDPDCFFDPVQPNNNCNGRCVADFCIEEGLDKPTTLDCGGETGDDGFLFFDTPTSFNDANFICQVLFGEGEEGFGSLAFIENQGDLDLISGLVQPFLNGDGMWVGYATQFGDASPAAFQSVNPFVNGTEFVTNANVGENPWAAGQPDGFGTQCVQLNQNGLLEDSQCEELKPFACRVNTICNQIATVQCFEDKVLGLRKDFVVEGYEYSSEVSALPYSQINNFCEEIFIPKNAESLAIINTMLSRVDDRTGVWAGIDANLTGNQGNPANFRNLDGDTNNGFYATVGVGEFPWGPLQPENIVGNDCVIVNKFTGLFESVNCFEAFYPVCLLDTDFCSGRADGVTPGPIPAPTPDPTPSPTFQPAALCSSRPYGIMNPIAIP